MCLSSTICRGFFVFNGLRLEMDVRFVDIIGGAVNHRFCFITCDFLLFSLRHMVLDRHINVVGLNLLMGFI
jgi:hypothetical protein